MVEADLHDIYGVDITDPTIRSTKTWRWAKARITGLLTRPPMVAGQQQDGSPILLQTTRIGLQLQPPAT